MTDSDLRPSNTSHPTDPPTISLFPSEGLNHVKISAQTLRIVQTSLILSSRSPTQRHTSQNPNTFQAQHSRTHVKKLIQAIRASTPPNTPSTTWKVSTPCTHRTPCDAHMQLCIYFNKTPHRITGRAYVIAKLSKIPNGDVGSTAAIILA